MSVLESAIGWLAPPQCIVCGAEGLALCSDCATSEIVPLGDLCWHCSALTSLGRTCPACRRLGGPSSVWISTNFEDPAQKLVHLYKFGQLRAAAEPITELMVGTFSRLSESSEQSKYLVIPIPTATSRVRQRGFDHSTQMAKLLARKLGYSYRPALGRLGQSRQLGSLRSQRLTQAVENYYVRLPRIVNGRNVLLVDDVVTTGATLIGATQALRKAGARQVDALVFAKRL